MKSFYECIVSFREPEADKVTKLVIFVDAITFGSGEEIIADYMTNTIGSADHELNSMSKKFYHELVIKNNEGSIKWHEVKVKVLLDGKLHGETYLVTGGVTETALKLIREYLKDSIGEPEVDSIKFKKVDDILIHDEALLYKSISETLDDNYTIEVIE